MSDPNPPLESTAGAGAHDAEPVACRLSSAELAARLERIRREVVGRGRARLPAPGRLELHLPPEPGLLARVEELVEMERECCPFLTFDVRSGDDGTRVTVTGPAAADGILRGWVGKVVVG